MRDGASSAERYRERAEQIRAGVEMLADPETQQILLKIAADYEQLANTLDANAPRRPWP